MPDPADPSATLEAIKADLRLAADGGLLGIKAGDYLPAALARHARVLLAAVEAALDLADDWDAESDNLDDLAERPGTDEEGAPVMAGQAIAYHDCAEALREAITRALNGETGA